LEQERLEPLAGASVVANRIAACAAKIPNRLVGGLGDVDGLQVPGTVRPREFLIRARPLVSPVPGDLRQSSPAIPKARCSASRRSVLILSPEPRGILEVATTMQW